LGRKKRFSRGSNVAKKVGVGRTGDGKAGPNRSGRGGERTRLVGIANLRELVPELTLKVNKRAVTSHSKRKSLGKSGGKKTRSCRMFRFPEVGNKEAETGTGLFLRG